MQGCCRSQLKHCRTDKCTTAAADARAGSNTKGLLTKWLIVLLLCRPLSTSLITDQPGTPVNLVEQVPPPPNRSSYFASLQIIVFQNPPPFPPIFPPAQVLTHCNLHTCWWVTSFFYVRCVCFTPVPLLEQTALAQKATKLHIFSLGSIFHPCVESRPECCNSCSAISADKTLCPVFMLSIYIHAHGGVHINKGLFSAWWLVLCVTWGLDQNKPFCISVRDNLCCIDTKVQKQGRAGQFQEFEYWHLPGES